MSAALQFVETRYHAAKSWYSFFRFVKNPESTEQIFSMAQEFKKASTHETVDKMISKVYADPDFQSAYDKKYFPRMPSIEELQAMPENSLGQSFYQFIMNWNLDINLFPSEDASDRSQYFLSRIYQSHDVWHVLTNYGTSLEDELALQAFTVGQNRQPLSLLLVSGGLIHLLQKDAEKSYQYLTAITDGFHRGSQAKNLLIHPLIERMRDPLEQVRRDLNILPRAEIK